MQGDKRRCRRDSEECQREPLGRTSCTSRSAPAVCGAAADESRVSLRMASLRLWGRQPGEQGDADEMQTYGKRATKIAAHVVNFST